jgi:DNA-binding transcriptional regulator YiaG
VDRTEALLLVRARRAVEDGSARRIREAAGLSQSEVARICGVTPAAVARWEQNERRPRGAAAIVYARLLNDLEAVVS